MIATHSGGVAVRRELKLVAGATVGILVFAQVSRKLLIPWQRNWGATYEETGRELPGDHLVENPNYVTTRAITVRARPEDIYPWLVQMGYRRGGLYSYDFLDRIFGFIDAPSARHILPEFQHLSPGEGIPLGRGEPFPVRELIPNRAFVLGGEDPASGFEWSWQTVMEPIDEAHTRLITRNRGRVTETPLARLGLLAMDIAAFIMVRRWLIVLKERAEALHAERAVERQESLDAVTGDVALEP